MDPESTPEQIKTVEDYKRRDAKRHAQRLADDLRDLADQIERIAKDFDHIGERGDKTYASVVGNMQQKLFNALTNAGMGQLIQDAGEADNARGAGI